MIDPDEIRAALLVLGYAWTFDGRHAWALRLRGEIVVHVLQVLDTRWSVWITRMPSPDLTNFDTVDGAKRYADRYVFRTDVERRDG